MKAKKVSEVIALLQSQLEQQGDLPCVICDIDNGCYFNAYNVYSDTLEYESEEVANAIVIGF